MTDMDANESGRVISATMIIASLMELNGSSAASGNANLSLINHNRPVMGNDL